MDLADFYHLSGCIFPTFALFGKLWLKRTEEIPNPAEPTCRDGGVSSEGRSMTL
ncbi:hypothetical protein [Mesorhizobium sp. L2C066B000]|uniref:hypothetical protein n=1 Tax=Mesorhizobium sp. L2C066B000 TaxID=1287105 RepID=UPI001FDA3F78|nr:hypothetical protein [Mesorhizobium sp. L2C066B000]